MEHFVVGIFLGYLGGVFVGCVMCQIDRNEESKSRELRKRCVMKTLTEMIAVMQHFADDGQVTSRIKGATGTGAVFEADDPSWNWEQYDYDIYWEKRDGSDQ